MWVLQPKESYRVNEKQILAGKLCAGAALPQNRTVTFYSGSGATRQITLLGVGHFGRSQPENDDLLHFAYEGASIQPQEIRPESLVSDAEYQDALTAVYRDAV